MRNRRGRSLKETIRKVGEAVIFGISVYKHGKRLLGTVLLNKSRDNKQVICTVCTHLIKGQAVKGLLAGSIILDAKHISLFAYFFGDGFFNNRNSICHSGLLLLIFK